MLNVSLLAMANVEALTSTGLPGLISQLTSIAFAVGIDPVVTLPSLMLPVALHSTPASLAEGHTCNSRCYEPG